MVYIPPLKPLGSLLTIDESDDRYIARINEEVELKDGARIRLNVFLPRNGGPKWPVLMGSSPYGKDTYAYTLTLPLRVAEKRLPLECTENAKRTPSRAPVSLNLTPGSTCGLRPLPRRSGALAGMHLCIGTSAAKARRLGTSSSSATNILTVRSTHSNSRACKLIPRARLCSSDYVGCGSTLVDWQDRAYRYIVPRSQPGQSELECGVEARFLTPSTYSGPQLHVNLAALPVSALGRLVATSIARA